MKEDLQCIPVIRSLLNLFYAMYCIRNMHYIYNSDGQVFEAGSWCITCINMIHTE